MYPDKDFCEDAYEYEYEDVSNCTVYHPTGNLKQSSKFLNVSA